MLGFVLPRRAGGLVLGTQRGLATFDPQDDRLDVFARPEADRPRNRFNDGRCDPCGRLWAGTMDVDCAAGAGRLYRVGADRSVQRMLDGLSISNGLCWSSDGSTFYFIDSAARRVDAFDLDAVAGTIACRRPAVRVDASLGFPDGMTIDEEGMLWVAHWGGGAVRRWDPRAGRLLASIDVPATHVSSCCFGGPRLGDLYITTAWSGLTGQQRRDQPLAGSLFVARPGVRGQPPVAFAG